MWLVEQCSQLGSLMTTQRRASPPFSACSTENTEPQHAPERIRHHVGDSQRLVNQSELSDTGEAPAPAGSISRWIFSNSSLTRRSWLSKSRLAALGLHGPRMVNTSSPNTTWPPRQTHHQRFHSLGDAFWAGMSFFSARSRLPRFCEWAPTLAAISLSLTGWPFSMATASPL